ncbi:lysylphosphatidylglycerol synthase domain-containing protein [Afipia sp. TerB]
MLLLAALWLVYRSFGGSGIGRSFASLNALTLIGAALAILLSSLFAGLRVRSIAAGFGYHLSVRDAVATVSLGQIGGALFFQIFGQVAARSSYLSRRSVPFAGTVLVTTMERIAAALVSFALAIAGALYLFRQITFDLASGGELIRIVIGVMLSTAGVAWLWRREVSAFAAGITARDVSRAAHAVGYSLTIQLATMAAYIVLGHTLAPSVALLDLAAAATLVMFAASIPISFAGWGVREMSAVAALGAVGMPGDASLTVAIVVGVLSLVCAGALGALTARHHKVPAAPAPAADDAVPVSRPDLLLTAVLPVLAALFVFFQVHLPTQSGAINVNLADPFAIVGGVMLLLAARHGAPRWRMSGVNLHVVLCTLALTLALLIGASHIGWTQWAVTNKYLGWFVLLAFAATGALGAKHDAQRLLDTFVIAGGIVVAVQVAILYLNTFGLMSPDLSVAGFAQNANAFAFQCLMLLGVTLAQRRPRPLLIALALSAVLLTGSRAGMGAACVVMATALVFIPGVWKPILKGIVGFGLIIALMIFSPMIVASLAEATMALLAKAGVGTGTGTSISVFLSTTRLAASRVASDNEHWISMESGLRMFLAHPIFGAGLGVFIHDWPGKIPLVIHSTSIWLLAEFGLVGAAIFLIPVVRLFVSEAMRFRRNDTAGYLIILIIGALASMSLFHELLYQRTFWFLLGAALAVLHAPVAAAEGRPRPS